MDRDALDRSTRRFSIHKRFKKWDLGRMFMLLGFIGLLEFIGSLELIGLLGLLGFVELGLQIFDEPRIYSGYDFSLVMNVLKVFLSYIFLV
jgi:hypothetical protein